MELLEIPQLPVLRGEEAIAALNDYIKELVEQKNEEVTDKQAKALVQLAQSLISSIETEAHPATHNKKLSESGFMMHLKKTIRKNFSSESPECDQRSAMEVKYKSFNGVGNLRRFAE